MSGPGPGTGPLPVARAERARRWVLTATILASSMAFIDTSVINVALPSIQSHLAAPVSQAQWTVNAYGLMLGALILVGGAAGDHLGRRRICITGILLFTGASVACGLAPTAAFLIVVRATQGIGGALLVPSSLAIISATFPADERGRAIGTWAGASALTTAFGPLLGGWLVDTWSWRAIFFVNVPIALVALLLVIRWVPESRNELSTGVDWRGGVLAVVGLGLLVYGLTVASSTGWAHRSALGSLIAGVLVRLMLLWWEARATSPMLPLSLFRSSTFSGANAITLLLYFALGGQLFFVPFDLINIQGYTATGAGAAFLPFSLMMAALSRWSGGLNERYGARLLLIVGPLIAAGGLTLFAIPTIGGSYWATFFPAMIVLGFGMTLSVAPLTTTVMSAVEDQYAGAASGINNATARIAGMLAVALLGAVAAGVFKGALDRRLENLQMPAVIRQALLSEVQKLAEASPPPQADSATRKTLQRALDEAFVSSFRVTTLIAALAALLSAACAWLTIEQPPARATPTNLRGIDAPTSN